VRKSIFVEKKDLRFDLNDYMLLHVLFKRSLTWLMLLHVRYVQIVCDFISFSMIQIGDPYVLEPYKSKDDKASLLDAAIRRHDGNAIVAATLFMRDTLKRGSALYIYVTFLVVVVVGQDDGPFKGSTNKNLFL